MLCCSWLVCTVSSFVLLVVTVGSVLAICDVDDGMDDDTDDGIDDVDDGVEDIDDAADVGELMTVVPMMTLTTLVID